MFQSIVSLLLRDVVFVAVLAILVTPICLKMKATTAVLKRNFIGYFSNPTGYVFLCLFVLLTSFAAFWPHDFFNTNLANLDQLNKYLPYIMLVFIPAITMSIWAEEKRQGTDELLLTLPAGDFDIVMGKYLAAAAIFTASLLFSQLSNFAVLVSLTLGDMDTGLFFATYFGYWLVGMAMLAVGMVASFVTGNLTVGFILGAAFNAPLVFAAHADVIVPSPTLSRLVAGWSLSFQFDDFGRGVLSLSGMIYFALMAVVGLYLSMILISSRHWSGGQKSTIKIGHFLVRTVALVVVALAVNFLFTNTTALSNMRRDLTKGKVGSLSPDTKRLLSELKPEHPIIIEAFISGQVPEVYAKTKSELISLLKEFRATTGKKMDVQIHVLDETREESIEIQAMAEDRYGIKPQAVRTRSRGTIKDENIFLAAAFTCGLEKVVVPFFDYGIPAEYELIRSICTVAKKDRKRVGIVRTDAQMSGGFSFAGGRPQQMPKQLIVEELEKQYEVKEIDPSSTIEPDAYDVMIVVQPSSLAPEQFDNVVEAIKNGIPTAVFEDPRPIFLTSAPATGEPKRSPMGGMGGMMGGMGGMGGGGPQPKGDIQKLWNVLGLKVPGQSSQGGMGGMGGMMGGMGGMFEPDLVWQAYNPYQKLQIRGIPDEWVFCRREAPGGDRAINEESPITSGLSEIFFPVPGVIQPSKDSELKFTPLVSTGELAGTMPYEKFMDPQNQENPLLMKAAQGKPKGSPQVIAARIQEVSADDKKKEDKKMSDAGLELAQADAAVPAAPAKDAAEKAESEKPAEATDDEKPAAPQASDKPGEKATDAGAGEKPEPEKKRRPMDVVYVADIDLMISTFLRIRARPGEDEEISWQFENVTFLLNIIDVLAKEEDFIEIRKRKLYHGTLKMVERWTQKAQEDASAERANFQSDFDDAVKKAEEENKKEIEKFEKTLRDLEEKQKEEGQTGIRLGDLRKAGQDLAEKAERLNRKLTALREQKKRQRDENIERIQRKIDIEILGIKNWYKFWAVIVPPIPPLLVGLVVFVRRRLREREGVAKSRLR